MRDLIYLAIFKKIAERRNFTSVAHELGLTPSAVSRQITRLEDQLGVQLLVRTTRHIRLTKAGEELYESCSRSLADLEEATDLISRQSDEPRGPINVSSTPCFGRLHVAPAIPEFLRDHPKVTVDFTLSFPSENFVESGTDILIQGTMLRGGSVTFENLAPLHNVICAAPEYIKRHGRPNRPSDLRQHNCLISSQPELRLEWRFVERGKTHRVRVSGNLRTNSMETLYTAVMQGLGIARLPNYVIGPELRSGRLVSIFPSGSSGKVANSSASITVGTNTMKAFYVRGRFPNLATSAFINFLKVRFKNNYDWEHRSASL
jgi:DNA-binding transcriptional LysR family regulator